VEDVMKEHSSRPIEDSLVGSFNPILMMGTHTREDLLLVLVGTVLDKVFRTEGMIVGHIFLDLDTEIISKLFKLMLGGDGHRSS